MKKVLVLLTVALMGLTSFAGTVTIFNETMIKTTTRSVYHAHSFAEEKTAQLKINSGTVVEFKLMDEGYYGATALAEVKWDNTNVETGTAFVYKSTGDIVGKPWGTWIDIKMKATPDTDNMGYAKASIIGYLKVNKGMSWEFSEF